MVHEEDWDGVYVHMGVACEQSASSAEVACGKYLSTYMGPHGRPGSMESEVGYTWDHELTTCPACWAWIRTNVKRCQTCRAFCGADECENCLPRCVCGAFLWNLDGYKIKVPEQHTEHCQKLIELGHYPRQLHKWCVPDAEHQEAFGTTAFTREHMARCIEVVDRALNVNHWLVTVPLRYRRIALVGLAVVFNDNLHNQRITPSLLNHAVHLLSDWYSRFLWPDYFGDIYEEPDPMDGDEEADEEEG